MHDYIVDELEFGTRVATVLDEENNCWGAEGMLFWHTVDYRAAFEPMYRPNPITKQRPWKGRSTHNTIWVISDPWIATCPVCGLKITRVKTRKLAKDRLYEHMKVHGGP
jgi:hypothetical protein